MVKRKDIPQETETIVEEDDIPDILGKTDEILDNWAALQRLLDSNEGLSVMELFERGWRPYLKTKGNHEYMILRIVGTGEDGKRIDTERSLGPYNAEKWAALKSVYDTKEELQEETQTEDESQSEEEIQPENISRRQSSPLPELRVKSVKSPALKTKVARIAPIGPSVQINLGTLQWYTWVQQKAKYPGSLDDFINDTVDSYFREYHHLELAVIVQED